VLQKLRRDSSWAQVKIPRGFGNGAIWPSLFTGVNPGRHGRYFYRQLKLGTYDIERFVEDTDFGHRPFWEFLSEAGRQVAVIDIVKAPLSKDLNGVQLCDWMTHDRTGPARSWPAQLLAEVVARYGSDPFDGHTDEFKERTAEELSALRDAMIERVSTKISLCERFMDQRSWDLFMVSFPDAHDIGHQSWHLHDHSHANYETQWGERFGDPVKAVYVALDGAVGRLLDRVDPQTTVVLFAGPGMGPDYTGNFLFENLLRRLDGRPEKDRNLIPHAILKCLWPAPIRRFGQRINAAKHLYSMSRRRCFSVPHNENAGAIRINLFGREPGGRIRPGAEYDTYCRTLTRELLELTNADTGKPVVREVVRVSDICHGKYVEHLPDMLAVWARDAPIRAVSSPKVGIVHGHPVIGARTGDHNSDCVLYVQGPSVNARGEMPPIQVEDIAPTITALLDTPLPDCDGSPIPFA
jgi:predicted AlkP superfamily phosphohydrolase/phosphomutase